MHSARAEYLAEGSVFLGRLTSGRYANNIHDNKLIRRAKVQTCVRLVLAALFVLVLVSSSQRSIAAVQDEPALQRSDLPPMEAWEIPRRGISFAFGLCGGILGVYAFKPSQSTANRKWTVLARDILLGGITAAIMITKTPDAGEILSHSLAMGAMWQTVLQATFQAAKRQIG